jgi:hypothetical protein
LPYAANRRLQTRETEANEIDRGQRRGTRSGVGRLWFSNWGAGEIIAVDTEGNGEVMARVPTITPFCFDWLDGRMLVVGGKRLFEDGRAPKRFLLTDTKTTRTGFVKDSQ